MPIVVDPEQLAVIAGALDTYRKSKNVDPGSELYERAAQRVICVFESGIRDPRAMSHALADAMEKCTASAFFRPRRRVDKERVERATREAKAVIDAESSMRRIKADHLKALSLSTQAPKSKT